MLLKDNYVLYKEAILKYYMSLLFVLLHSDLQHKYHSITFSACLSFSNFFCAYIFFLFYLWLLISFIYADNSKSRSASDAKKEPPIPKDGPTANIAAQTFTFRELAAATNNFRPECLLGEGGFGRVYKGRLESTGQVSCDFRYKDFGFNIC